MTETRTVLLNQNKLGLLSYVTPLMYVYSRVMNRVIDKEIQGYPDYRMIEEINETGIKIELYIYDSEILKSTDYIPDWIMELENLIKLYMYRSEVISQEEFKIFNTVRNFSLKTLLLSGTFNIKHLDPESIEYFVPSLSELTLYKVGLESIGIPANVRKMSLIDNFIRTIECPTKELNIERLDLQNNRIFIRNPEDTMNEYEELIHPLTQDQEEEPEEVGYGFYADISPYLVSYEGDGPVPVLDPKVFSEMKNLKRLNLSRNWMIRYINLDDFKHCKWLDLSFTGLEEVRFTSETTDLELLEVISTYLSEYQIEEIQDQYPDMKIYQEIQED